MFGILAAGNGNWLPHDINEVYWNSAAFFIVVGLIIWKAGPAIKAAIAARPARIAEELEGASASRLAGEGKVAEVKAALADSDKEAARIVSEAREAATRLQADTVTRAENEAATIRERGNAEIAAARRQAQADLTAEVSRLALGAAERVVESNLNDATQQSLIDSYITQVGATN